MKIKIKRIKIYSNTTLSTLYMIIIVSIVDGTVEKIQLKMIFKVKHGHQIKLNVVKSTL